MVLSLLRQSAGVVESMKSQAPSTKLQINLKFQYQMTKTSLEFGILVIVICLIFEICYLEFLVTPALHFKIPIRLCLFSLLSPGKVR